MGVLRSVPSIVTVVLATVFGAFGLLGVDSDEAPPARVVEAVADTSGLTPIRVEPPMVEPAVIEPTTTVASAPSSGPPPPSTTAATVTTLDRPTTIADRPVALAPTTEEPVATPTLRQRGERALSTFSYDWRNGIPGWEISFHEARSGVLGYTFVDEQRIEVYVRPEMSDALLAHVIAHEIGHAVDVTHNSGENRAQWQRLRGIEDKPWWPGSGATDFSTGAGDFAESFAAWQVGDNAFRSMIGDPPDENEIALIEELSRVRGDAIHSAG